MALLQFGTLSVVPRALRLNAARQCLVLPLRGFYSVPDHCERSQTIDRQSAGLLFTLTEGTADTAGQQLARHLVVVTPFDEQSSLLE